MTRLASRLRRRCCEVGTVSLMCFSVALAAFGAAIVGCILNHLLAGWMAAGGMLTIGLFYVALGIFNWGADPKPVPQGDSLPENPLADSIGPSAENSRTRPHPVTSRLGKPLIDPALNLTDERKPVNSRW